MTPTVANAILNDIARGFGEPQGSRRYSNAPAASEDRAAWAIVRQHCPNKPEGDCRRIIHAWIENGVLYTEKYNDPVERKARSGLLVDNAKRPT